jgi:hypothetical protein
MAFPIFTFSSKLDIAVCTCMRYIIVSSHPLNPPRGGGKKRINLYLTQPITAISHSLSVWARQNSKDCRLNHSSHRYKNTKLRFRHHHQICKSLV